MTTKTDQIISITTNTRDYLQAVYLDYLNNFTSYTGFAEFYGLSHGESVQLIMTAKRVHDERTIKQEN
jgi:hypothetical protein